MKKKHLLCLSVFFFSVLFVVETSYMQCLSSETFLEPASMLRYSDRCTGQRSYTIANAVSKRTFCGGALRHEITAICGGEKGSRCNLPSQKSCTSLGRTPPQLWGSTAQILSCSWGSRALCAPVRSNQTQPRPKGCSINEMAVRHRDKKAAQLSQYCVQYSGRPALPKR